MKRLILFLFCALVLAGCASKAKSPDDVKPLSDGRPGWVYKGGAAFADDGKKAMYGVGLAEGINSEALRRTTADNRAINEISKQLATMSTSLMRDYMSATSSVEKGTSSGEQYVENTVKTFTSNTLTGVKIIDRWDNGKVAYSLASINLDDLKAMTDTMKELSAEVKEYIKANAENAFDKLDQEQANIQ